MTNEQVSAKTLWKATAGAVLVGSIALVTLILPAEYNIDPTGVGNALGLTILTAKEVDILPREHSGELQAVPASETIQLALPPGSELEYKMHMETGAQLTFEWATDGPPVYVDMHGEPEGDTSGYFLSFAETTVDSMKGSFSAVFTGPHGWYFKNTSDQPLHIRLTFKGQFQNPHIM